MDVLRNEKKAVAHPEWLPVGLDKLKRNIRLLELGRMPEQIQRRMLVTALQYNLRLVLGLSNWGCAWWLVWNIACDRVRGWSYPVRYWKQWRQAKREIEAALDQELDEL